MKPVLLAIAALLWPVSSGADAVVHGGGAALFARLGMSPGSPVNRSSIALDAGLPVPGIGVRSAAIDALYAGRRLGLGAGGALLTTPVGERVDTHVAVRMHLETWRLGVAAQARNWRFDRYVGAWDVVLRAGAGWSAPHGIDTVLRLERVPQVPVAIAVGVRAPLGGRAVLEVQVERLPGRATRWQAGVAAAPAGFVWRAGIDLETLSASLGCTWRWEALSLVWGARTHPHLGWSHAWTCERSL